LCIAVETASTFSLILRNAEPRRGVETSQAYIGPVENATVPVGPKSLVGFQRIELEPGA
jgi:hypothetical protein